MWLRWLHVVALAAGGCLVLAYGCLGCMWLPWLHVVALALCGCLGCMWLPWLHVVYPRTIVHELLTAISHSTLQIYRILCETQGESIQCIFAVECAP